MGLDGRAGATGVAAAGSTATEGRATAGAADDAPTRGANAVVTADVDDDRAAGSRDPWSIAE